MGSYEMRVKFYNMNRYAKALYIVGWIVLIGGILGSFIIGFELGVEALIVGIFSSIISGLALLGFGQVIEILDDNRNYLKKLTESQNNCKEK